MVRAAQENRLKKIKAIKVRGIIHQQENKLFIESIPFCPGLSPNRFSAELRFDGSLAGSVPSTSKNRATSCVIFQDREGGTLCRKRCRSHFVDSRLRFGIPASAGETFDFVRSANFFSAKKEATSHRLKPDSKPTFKLE